MKKNIHPKYHSKASIACACGAVLDTGSTRENLKVELCSKCHPFFTGKQRFVDTQGRLDRFNKKLEKFHKISDKRKDIPAKAVKQAAKAKKQSDKVAKKEK